VPDSIHLRQARQEAILDLVGREAVRNQGQLVERLTRRGMPATQSSVSRDLRELGIVKASGRYAAPVQAASETAALEEVLHFVRGLRSAGPHLLVIQTAVGAAQSVAIGIDRCRWPECVGTVAGDDTIFAATAGVREQTHLLQRLERLRLEAERSQHPQNPIPEARR
jgi:transcriptional regulator of arginine metabolism